MTEEQQCYYRGTVYPTTEDFLKQVKYFHETPVNSESIESLSRDFIENLKVNLTSLPVTERISNQQLAVSLENALNGIVYNLFDPQPDLRRFIDEMYKLFLIIKNSETDTLHRSYLQEKLITIIAGGSITLHPVLQREFEQWKQSHQNENL